MTKKEKPTLEELKAFFAEREKTMRQHGKKGKPCDNPEDEYKRLYNNYLSIKCRANTKQYHKRQDKLFEEYNNIYGRKEDADEFGIRPKDERMYKKCFKSYYSSAPVSLAYIRRMTALSLTQIYVLQKRTGYIPKPAVTKKDAKKDLERVKNEGITALI